jgi:dienelactone hydrolase
MSKRQSPPTRQELLSLLGELPPRTGVVGVECAAIEERAGYTLERLVLDLNGCERVPALFTRPRGGNGPMPAVLFNHSHGGAYQIGKQELVTARDHLQSPPYAEALAGRGIAALAIDHWVFGERRGRSESEVFKEMLWTGRVLWGMMVFDSLRAVDYLTSRADIDASRIATLGMSMGSTMAWWVAALDERVRVCIDICCLTDFDALLAHRHLDGHGVYYYVPRILQHFSTADINALIAPRAHLSVAGRYDRLTPPDGLERIDRELRRVYAAAGAPDAWRLSVHDTGHLETAAMRAEIMQFLDRFLITV